MKRIYSLDFLKLVFAYIIAFFHFGVDIAPGPTVAVQVFFIVSGFFLGKKFYSRSHPDPEKKYDHWAYTLDHVKGLYPHYLFSMAALFLYVLARNALELVRDPAAEHVKAICLSFYNQIPDLLLLQSAYTFHDSLNYPLWQLSALVIAGFFVYGLLCQNERLSRTLLFPAAILMIQSLLNTGVDLFANYGPFYMPLLRAFSPLCIGVLACYFTTTSYYPMLRRHTLLFNLAPFLALVTIVVYQGHYNIFLMTTPFLLWGCAAEDSWINKLLNRRIFRRCGKFSYAVYLNHALIARFVQARITLRYEMESWKGNLLYFVLLTVYSVFTLYLVERWCARKQK